MAVPTAQPGTSQTGSPPPRFPPWLRKYTAILARPLFALVLALIAIGILILVTASGSFGDRFGTVLASYQALWTGSFGGMDSIAYTLVTITPLIFATLSVAISFRAGLFNIGAAGQMIVGAMAADILALKLPGWPGWLLIPAMMIISILAGSVWGGIVGVLKAWRGAHEVVTTIMLNWVAFFVTDYLIYKPFAAPGGTNQSLELPTQTHLPAIVSVLDSLFKLNLNPFEYPIDISLFLALLALVVYWFLDKRTAFGYEIRVLGRNPKAALYAGIRAKRNIILVMVISGAFAGLGGALHLMGQPTYQLTATSAAQDPTGFDAIGASLLGMNTALGSLFGSLIFGGLRSASSAVQAATGMSGAGYIVQIMEALILFCLASEFIPGLRRFVPRWLHMMPGLPGRPADGNGALRETPTVSSLVGQKVLPLSVNTELIEPLAEGAVIDSPGLKEE